MPWACASSSSTSSRGTRPRSRSTNASASCKRATVKRTTAAATATSTPSSWPSGSPPRSKRSPGGPPQSLAGLQPQLFFAEAPAPLGERFLLFAEAAVAVVEGRHPQLQLVFLPCEPRLRGDDMALTIGHVDLSRLDARQRLRQPGAALLELGGRALELACTMVELLRTVLEPGQPLLLLAHVAQPARELRLLLRQLCRPPPEPLFAGGVPYR